MKALRRIPPAFFEQPPTAAEVSASAEPNGGEFDEPEPNHATETSPEADTNARETKPTEPNAPAPRVAPILDGLERWLSRNGTPPQK